MLRLQDPMTRQTGWYDIMPRGVNGKFKQRQTAFWERKYGAEYGEWTYQNGTIRAVDERINDDLVLKRVES